MIFLKYWKLVAVAGLLLVSNALTYRYVHRAWDAEKATASRDAAAAARKKEQDDAIAAHAQAENTRNLEEAYAKEIAAAHAAGADAERGYLDSLRALQGRFGRCSASTEALGAIVAADGARSREDRLAQEIGRDFREVGERANELAATVRLCVAWANENGR